MDVSQITAVSIIRAGDSMLDAFMAIAPEASVGIRINSVHTHKYACLYIHTHRKDIDSKRRRNISANLVLLEIAAFDIH